MTNEITKEQALKLIKDLNQDRKELKEQLEQKNKIIEEAKKWVTNYKLKWDFDDETGLELNELLDILNKGVDE